MLLGKRPRPAIKRTTSMTEFSLDVGTTTTTTVEGGDGGGGGGGDSQQFVFDPNNPFKGLDRRFMAAASVSPRPRSVRRNSADFAAASETAHFLRACSLCKRRLVPGRDIYMYRGDSAFCSLECRQQQMNQDERKEKCSLVASKKENASIATASSQVSTEAETVAAV